MSLFSSMTTAVSGLNAQGRALGAISDNVANSQTVGFKRTDTSFQNHLTQSTAAIHESGAVTAKPNYTNSIQGTIEQTENPLAMAVAGQGFFPVQSSTGEKNGVPAFDAKQFYTRAGDFSLDRNGFMVNSAGYFLQGWQSQANGTIDRTSMAPIRVSQAVFNPVATSKIDLGANLPTDPTTPSTSTQVQVYDALGHEQPVNLNWTRTSADRWTLSIDAPGDIASASRGSVDVVFGATSGNPVSAGTIGNLGGETGSVTPVAFAANGDASLTFTADFGQGPQTLTLDMGTYGVADGITQYAGTDYNVRSLSQNGIPLGSFSSVATRETGDIVVNYDNGQTRLIGKIPVVTFSSPDQLQQADGQAFTRTLESGEARLLDANNNGAGKIVTSSVERSNVDIATEFTKLIVAQRAYSANTRIVTTSDQMLQDTINMAR